MTRLVTVLLLLGLGSVSPATADGRPYRARIVDEAGRPVRGAVVEVGIGGEASRTIGGRSDARGRISVDVGDAGIVQVRARTGDGRVGASPVLSTEGCAESDCWVPGLDRVLEVTVTAPASVQGRIRGPRDRGITGAHVALRWMGLGQGTILDRVFQDELEVAATRLRRHRLGGDEIAEGERAVGTGIVAATDATGFFALEAPHPGVYALVVDAQGMASAVSAPHQLLPGRTAAVDMALAPGFELQATMQDPRGNPAAYGVIEIATADGCERVWRPVVSGRATVFPGLPLGRYRVWGEINIDGVAMLTSVVEVASDGRDQRVTLGGRGAVTLGYTPSLRCSLPDRPEPQSPPPPEHGPICDLGVDLYPVDGRMIVTPFWIVPRGLPLVEGDVVETVDGHPAPRTYVGRCGTSATIEALRPATGERQRVLVRLRRRAEY